MILVGPNQLYLNTSTYCTCYTFFLVIVTYNYLPEEVSDVHLVSLPDSTKNKLFLKAFTGIL